MQFYIKIIFLSACLSNLACVYSARIKTPFNSNHNETEVSLQRHKRDILSDIGKIVLKSIGGAAFSALKENILNRVQYPYENQCKFSFVHVGQHNLQPSGAIHSEWVTEDSDINRNYEKLDGKGLQVDSTGETMSSAFYLKEIKFEARTDPRYSLHPCIVAITINCGDQVLAGGGYTSIGYEDMLSAWSREGSPRDVRKASEADCVPFHNRNTRNSFIGMEVKVDALKCGNDRGCIRRNIEMY